MASAGETATHVIRMTGTGTAFSIIVASFCIVVLYILIISIYKPYERTLDASRAQEKEAKDDTQGGTNLNAASTSEHVDEVQVEDR